MAGVDLRTVSELMGDKSIEMIMRYSHLSSWHLHEAVNLLYQVRTVTTGVTSESTKEMETSNPLQGNSWGSWTILELFALVTNNKLISIYQTSINSSMLP